MSGKFGDLVKQLQTEHDKLVEEIGILRKELIQYRPAAGPQTKKFQGLVGQVNRMNHATDQTSKDSPKKDISRATKKNDVESVKLELQKQFGKVVSLFEDSESGVSLAARIFYRVENLSSMTENFFFYILIVITVLATIILGIFWKLATDDDSKGQDSFYFYFDMFQVIATGGIDDSLRSFSTTIVYTLATGIGLIIFAILIGIITDKFQTLIDTINEGRSVVPEREHTLLLGWNESTERVVCQLAFLRRQYIIANSGMKRILWWTRTPPATPVAKARIVILCDNKTKSEMHEAIENAFADRGISPKRTRVGWDVICRVGDPTDPKDLIMVGAHNAVAMAIMMTTHDLDEEAQGGSANAATFRTILALRKVLFDQSVHPPWQDMRIIVPLSRPSKAIHSAAFSAPSEDDSQVGRELMLLQDLSLFLNTLIFTCSTQPGLADIFMDLMNFDGVALRLRKVKDFPNGGEKSPTNAGIVGKTFKDMVCHWEDAVLVGVVPSTLMAPAEEEVIDPLNGMAPDSSRVIKKDDRLLFVCERSTPKEAKKIPPKTPLAAKGGFSFSSKKPMKILVCGFRKEWKSAARFCFRINETCKKLADHSQIHFLNQLPTSDFLDLMEKVCEQPVNAKLQHVAIDKLTKEKWTLGGRIDLGYTEGDSTDYDTLEGVIVANHGYDVTIVVPPVDSTMSAQAQDTRLMTIMCTLRTICEDNELPLVHVIGENKLESSAQLALRTKTADAIDETDFVNVQAIIARALCQAMAFPFMQPAVVQLFSSDEGTPSIHLSPATVFVPVKTKMYFSDLLAQVKLVSADAICIGYKTDAGIQLCPGLWHQCTFEDGDVVIVISREDPTSATQKLPTSAPDGDELKRATAGSNAPQTMGMSLDVASTEGAKPKSKAKVRKKAQSKKAGDDATIGLVDAQARMSGDEGED